MTRAGAAKAAVTFVFLVAVAYGQLCAVRRMMLVRAVLYRGVVTLKKVG